MTVRVILKPNYSDLNASWDSTDVKLRAKVVGTTNRNQAEALALAGLPSVIATNQGFVYLNDRNLVQSAYDQFDVEFGYSTRKNVAGEYTWDFDTTGGTVHITNAKESIKRYSSSTSELGSAAATAIPKHNGAIGVNKGDVSGTDIVVPAMKINVHFRHPLGQVTMAWAKVLADMTGKVNSTAFLDWDIGEVLFLGARGADGSQAEATITYQFAMSKNVDDLSIGAIANIAKKGWEYVWVSYKDEVSASAPARSPEFAYVERVYETEDFAGILGFG